MERDSFIFYKSFYEAIADLPKDIRLEILTAIIEYALFGRQPENLKPFAKGMFTLIKPNIDVNTARFENGKKGGRKGNASTPEPPAPEKDKQTPAPQPQPYTLTYEQEVERMKADDRWRKIVCEDFNITEQEYDKRLARFLDRCNDDKARKGKNHHDSFEDCQSHLRYWMSKAYAHNRKTTPAPDNASVPIPELGDSFGGVDYEEQ